MFFLIPLYNESENLVRLVDDTLAAARELKLECRLLMVNDGSTDDSLPVLERLRAEHPAVTIVSYTPNRGVRAAFMAGFKEFLAQASEGDVLVTKEADNTSDNGILARLLQKVEVGGCDLALASCYMKGGGFERTSPWRLLLSAAANLLVKIRFGLWGLHTFSSFYRVFSYECVRRTFAAYGDRTMSMDGFCCVVEMLVNVKKLGMTIGEVPMVLRSSERKGKSKMPVLKTIKGYLKLCLTAR